MKVVLREVLSRVRLGVTGEAEETARKRFTFAPSEGAEAVVQEVLPMPAMAGRRRFPAETRTPRVSI
jgi:hypothetical protein